MVEDPGKTLHADTGKPVTGDTSAYKPVNMPVPVKIEENAAGQPVAIRGKRRLAVMTIEDKWRIDDEWWRAEPVSRIYYNILLASRRRLYSIRTSSKAIGMSRILGVVKVRGCQKCLLRHRPPCLRIVNTNKCQS